METVVIPLCFVLDAEDDVVLALLVRITVSFVVTSQGVATRRPEIVAWRLALCEGRTLRSGRAGVLFAPPGFGCLGHEKGIE